MTVSVIQQAVPSVAGSSGTSYSVTLPAAPTSGNQLLLWLASGSSADSVSSGVAGWTLISSYNPGTGGKFFIYTKTSAGTETTTSIVFATSTSHNIAIQEWPASAQFGTITSGYLTGLTTSATLGPTDAPPAGGGTPSMFVYDNGAGDTSFTFPAGWTQAGPYPTSGFPYYSDVVAGGTATSSAVTAACTKGTRATTLAWSNIWVYATSSGTSITGSATTPAATASGTATASTQAAGGATAPAATATGAATSTTFASASATAPAATASGAASSGTTTAVGNATAPQATASGVSSSTTTATAAVTATSATATGVATSTSSTTVSGNAKAPSATASGIAAGYFTGHACGTSNQCAYCHIWRHIGPCWRYVVA